MAQDQSVTPPKKRKALKIAAIVCFSVAVALVIITYFFTLPAVQKSLLDINEWFTLIELYVASFNRWTALFIIIALFLSRSLFPIIPFSVIFMSCGMVFPTPVAVIINAVGLMLMCSIKFHWGEKRGGGKVHKLAGKSRRVTEFMDLKGRGNKWMLTLMCFIPFFPVGTVSRVYGATEMKLGTFLKYSLLGFLPRVLVWSYIGVNILNPFTIEFMAPFIVLSIISGISLLLLDALFNERKLKNEKSRN
ncbi:MAG: TVP38/TMEM64 family protein [Clostridia bacterium]|nr:TVP38/TMEM64 family protein [Clostridia bacterium]